MRGTQSFSINITETDRITPAHAGNTEPRKVFQAGFQDHPRACGEHLKQIDADGAYAGSPPRMRGTLVGFEQHSGRCGITPAHAGNTPHQRSSFAKFWDHPRACGEHFTASSSVNINMGSPPRMRGTLNVIADIRFCMRITPAHAGNTRPHPSGTL